MSTVIWLSGLSQLLTSTSVTAITHITLLFPWVLPAPPLNCKRLAGRDWASVTFLSLMSPAMLGTELASIQSVGKHGVSCVYQDREKIPTQHGGSPTASPLEYFSVPPPAASQHKSSTVDVLRTCHRPPSGSLLLLFPSESCSPLGAFLKPHPFPHLMQTFLITGTFPVLSLFGHPCGPCHKVPSATTYKLALLFPTGHGAKIFPCGIVSRK